MELEGIDPLPFVRKANAPPFSSYNPLEKFFKLKCFVNATGVEPATLRLEVYALSDCAADHRLIYFIL